MRSRNTYNIDEIGFVMGLGSSERVLEVIRHPRENGELVFRSQGNYSGIGANRASREERVLTTAYNGNIW